jgi:hypothetical protein
MPNSSVQFMLCGRGIALGCLCGPASSFAEIQGITGADILLQRNRRDGNGEG